MSARCLPVSRRGQPTAIPALIGLLLLSAAACASSDTLKPKSGADVRLLGDPQRRPLEIGHYIIDPSFGGSDFIVADPSLNYDPAYLEHLKEQEGDIHYQTYRYADFRWEGLVKNQGDLAADSVYVRMAFVGGFIDSAYVDGMTVVPNQTAVYQLYSRGQAIDRIDILWHKPE